MENLQRCYERPRKVKYITLIPYINTHIFLFFSSLASSRHSWYSVPNCTTTSRICIILPALAVPGQYGSLTAVADDNIHNTTNLNLSSHTAGADYSPSLDAVLRVLPLCFTPSRNRANALVNSKMLVSSQPCHYVPTRCISRLYCHTP